MAPKLKPPPVKVTYAPHPAKNLGGHLKPPKAGEIVTQHHRGAKPRG